MACGQDFTVILTWEGQVIDSRACLVNNAPHRHGGRTLAPLFKWPFPKHPVVAIAAAGAWSCEPYTNLEPDHPSLPVQGWLDCTAW